MKFESKPIVWMEGELKTPPLSMEARREAGYNLRLLQLGEALSMPISRPMPTIGPRCHELRIQDKDKTWRIVYHTADDAIYILTVFSKKTKTTPAKQIKICKQRLKAMK